MWNLRAIRAIPVIHEIDTNTTIGIDSMILATIITTRTVIGNDLGIENKNTIYSFLLGVVFE
jgi:hypothetical protein